LTARCASTGRGRSTLEGGGVPARRSWVEVLEHQAERKPHERAFLFLADGEREAEELTYGELHRQARSMAAALSSETAAGDRALLLFQPGLEFVSAFFGCLYAGLLAVPCYPPRPRRPGSALRAIAADCRPSVVLTCDELAPRLRSAGGRPPELADLPCRTVGELVEAGAGRTVPPGPAPTGAAFLQYTSGSTASPKGVVVDHANLLANSEMMQRAFGMSPESVVVGWLPLFHDMGLIGNVLQPLMAGASAVLLSPMAFLQRPLRWLEAISRYRGTVSGGPCFAFDLCARKLDDDSLEGLDLSSWEVAFCGAEPVRAEVLDRFAAAFGPWGFDRRAFYPCYGLAEATLFVTGGDRGSQSSVLEVDPKALRRGRAMPRPGGRRLVGCGRTWSATEVRIVEPRTGRPCRSGRIGEVWVRGPQVATGYWGNPAATAETFGAALDSRGPFLRTGDLGFLDGGELILAGRLKDLLVVRGRNHYPQDLEATAEASHPAVRPGCVAAFPVDGEREELPVIVCEVRRRPRPDVAEVLAAVRQAVTLGHELPLAEVVLVRAGTIPKTSSGKIRRRACRERYLAGSLETVAREHDAGTEAPRAGGAGPAPDRGALAALDLEARSRAIERWLAAELEAVTRSAPGSITQGSALTALGLDSMAAIDAAERIEAAMGVIVSPVDLLAGASLGELAERLAGEVAEAPGAASVETERPEPAPPDRVPLSLGQRAIWMSDRVAAARGAYNIVVAALVHGPLDEGRLRRCLQALVDRHGSLRATVHEEDGEPVLRIRRSMEVELSVGDASSWTDEDLQRHLGERGFAPFDLGSGPPLRVELLQASEGRRILLLAVHHLVADLGSLAVLFDELRALYADPAAVLPPVPVGPADLAARERAAVEGARGERSWRYWQRRLAGPLPVLDLPTDRPRPPVRSYGGGLRRLRIERSLMARLERVGRDRDATLFMVVLAGLQLLLHRLSGQSRILVGAPTAGRRRGDLQRAVGYLVDPVVLVGELPDRSSFARFLSIVRKRVLEAVDHADTPFALLVERLRPVRDPSRAAVFQALFAFQVHRGPAAELASFELGDATARLRLGDVTLHPLPIERRRAQFDLTWMAAPGPDGLALALEHDTALFDSTTAQRWLGHLGNLLAAVAEDPLCAVDRLPLLSRAERHQLLGEWSRLWDRPAPARPARLSAAFLEQAGRIPDAVAAVSGVRRLSYGALAGRVRRVAARLAELGVGPEVRVGLCADRGLPMLAGMLGVLEAGGVLVPLDPAYPAARLAMMIEDSGAALVLTAGSGRQALAGSRVERLDLEWLTGGSVASPAGPPAESATPQLAYLLYTSGSTGRPKGVAVEHRGTLELARWAGEVYSPRELDGVLASTSICFDLSVFELLVPLARGGKVIVARDALELPELPAAAEVRLVNSVPSAVTELLATAGLPPSVCTVNLAGEPLPASLVKDLYGLPGIERVFNLYGPSEDTTYSTWVRVAPEDDRPPGIGRPIGGTAAPVLDGDLAPVPLGVRGEIFLRGRGLARGYLGRPAWTAERFLPDPFGDRPGGRCYRTGDLACQRSDGSLRFLGRADHQVKLRGFRIELGEVEAALAEQPGVERSVVVVEGPGSPDPRLVAYVVPRSGRDLGASDLAEGLRRRLPTAMVPQAFVVLDSLPSTPNGKVDRRRLPAPPAREGSSPPSPSRQSRTEELLAVLWTDLLGAERLSGADDFFELGGHSLLASRLAWRAREAFGVDLTVSSVFEAPTLAQMAARIERARSERRAGGDDPGAGRPVHPVGRGGPLPLSPAQQALWFLDQLEPGSAAYNTSQAVELDGRLDVAALAAAFTATARRHEILRSRFPAIRGAPLLTISPPSPVPLPVVDLRGLPPARREEEVRRVTDEAVWRPFDLSNGPLLSARLLRLAEDRHRVILSLHHIVCDAWSVGVLMREIAAHYSAVGAAGRVASLGELPVQYADYSAWQRRRERGEFLERQLDYWRRRMAGAPEPVAPPPDRPRPAVRTRRGGRLPIDLGADRSSALVRLGQQRGATLFMTLAAALATLLYRTTGACDVTFGATFANRERPELEGLVGYFINMLALRVDLRGTPTFGAVLAQVREAALGAFDHQGVSFERVVEEVAPRRDLSHSPLFRVVLVLQNVPAPPARIPGLRLQEVVPRRAPVRFDLTLLLAERPEGLTGYWGFDLDLYEPATIEGLHGRFETLLDAVVEQPDQLLEALEIESAADRSERHGRRRSREDANLGMLRDLRRRRMEVG
jgi:amino acid adenylation domain-containing protein